MPDTVIVLPGLFLREGFTETEPDIVLRSEMDGGHVKRRLKPYPTPGSLDGTRYMTNGEYDDLIGIYRDAARSGNAFHIAHPVGGDAIKVAFAELPAAQPAPAPGKCRVPVRFYKFGTLPARAIPARVPLTWPPALPQYFQVSGFSHRPADNVLRSEPDDGAMQLRLRSLAGPAPLEGMMRMTTAQYAEYCNFYKNVARGVLPFAFPDTDGAGTIQVQFGAPPSRRSVQGREWLVGVKLEKR